MIATIGVNPDLYRGGVHVASLWPRPVEQSEPPPCYAHGAVWEREETLLAAYRADYTERTGERAPGWTLEELRKANR